MRHSALIRRLIDITIRSKKYGQEVDVCQATRQSSTNSIVRLALMRTVRDHRFIDILDDTTKCRQQTQHELEKFASFMEEHHKTLDEGIVQNLIDKFLDSNSKQPATERKNREIQQTRRDEIPAKEDGTPKQNNDGESQEEKDDKGTGDEKGRVENDAHHATERAKHLYNRKEIEQHLQREIEFLKGMPQGLVELAKRIGRTGDNSNEMRGRFAASTKSDIEGVKLSADLLSALPSELATLADPQTENLFLHRLATHRLQTFASTSHTTEKGKKHQHGPIIICLDCSSSMDGVPYETARILTIATCIIARREKRKVLICKYSDCCEYLKVTNYFEQSREVEKFLLYRNGTFNNEDHMFRELFSFVLPKEPRFSTADILCISDFGWGVIFDEAQKLIEKQKANGMKFYGLNIDSYEKAPSIDPAKTQGTQWTTDDKCWGNTTNNTMDELWTYYAQSHEIEQVTCS